MAGDTMMKALVKENPEEGYELKDVPIPDIGPDEVLFKLSIFVPHVFFNDREWLQLVDWVLLFPNMLITFSS